MLKIFAIFLLLTACRTTDKSYVSATTKISDDETLDLTKYIANEADHEKFRTELGDQYEKSLENMLSSISTVKPEVLASFNRLALEEKIAIYHYSAMGYLKLNKVLRKGDIEESAKRAGFIKVLSSALNKLPAVNAVVYRGGMLPS